MPWKWNYGNFNSLLVNILILLSFIPFSNYLNKKGFQITVGDLWHGSKVEIRRLKNLLVNRQIRILWLLCVFGCCSLITIEYFLYKSWDLYQPEILGSPFLYLPYAVILGPLAEEVLFRKTYYKYTRGFPLIYSGILNAIIFVFYHEFDISVGSLIMMMRTFVIALFFLFMCYRITRSLLFVFSIHAVNNTVILVFDNYLWDQLPKHLPIFGLLFIGVAVISFGEVALWINKKKQKCKLGNTFLQ
jgi:membrane protease YdiL (CAAX protease family)